MGSRNSSGIKRIQAMSRGKRPVMPYVRIRVGPHTRSRAMLGWGLMVVLVLACTGGIPTGPADAGELQVHATAAKMAESGNRYAANGRHVGPSDRPMHMRLTVELVGPVATPLPECLVGHFSSVIAGHATHLGKVSGVGSTCIMGLAPDADPPFLPPGPPPYATGVFSNPLWVLTAANGDELWLEAFDAVVVLGGVNPADGSYTSLAARGTHRVIGGTGRFAGATGELRTVAVNEDGQGPDHARSEGWIRY